MIACPACQTEGSIVLFVNLRRCYSHDSVSLDEKGHVTYDGYGEQVEDEMDYLRCDACESEWSAATFGQYAVRP